MAGLMTIPMVFGLQGWEIIIIALVFLLLFGGKKIPELMKGLGKGVRSFKEGMNDAGSDDKKSQDGEERETEEK